MRKNIVMSVIGGLILGFALTFGLTQSEVIAEDTEVKWACSEWTGTEEASFSICKSPGLKCVLYKWPERVYPVNLSCVKD